MPTKAGKIKAELLALKKSSGDGMLHAEKIVTWARAHRRSALHSQFEWDDTKAAREHRIWQARRLIHLVIVSEESTPQLVSLSIDRTKGGGYRDISDVVKSRKLSEIMLLDAVRDLERVQARFGRVRQLTSMWKEFDLVRARVRKAKKAA